MLVENLSIFLLILLSGSALIVDGVSRVKPADRRVRPTRQCLMPKLMNGFAVSLFRHKMVRFDCHKGFYRMGERYAECMSGRWSVYSYPICIKNGCSQLPPVDNAKISYLNQNATAMLFCEPNYEIVGSYFAHCNSTHWDRTLGTCKETDNAPLTSCDFESESICGWIHDADHDFDFERRSGYNRETITIQTGPSADHTVGLPFQGHFMVINTNTEVYLKTARLISPLYAKMDAEKLCFQFYYHMYGFSVGTLRVYVKPESVELGNILIIEGALEVNTDYVIFEIKGTQGNTWKRGNGTIKQFNESFQIIIEAVSGQTRLSDIAFDDVSILTDQDCTNGESNESDDDSNDDGNDAKEPDVKEDDDGIFNIESCVNRCNEDSNATVHLYANKTLSCSCSIGCDPKATCCPDFIDVCMKDDSLNDTTLSEISTTTQKLTTTSTSITTQKLTTTKASTTIRLTTSTLAKISSTIPPSTIKSTTTTTQAPTSTLKVISTQQQTDAPQTPQNAKLTTQQQQQESDFEELEKNSDEIEDEHEIMPEEMQLTNEKSQSKSSFFILTTSLVAVASVFLAFIAITIVYKQYRKTTNPLNYKEKSEGNSRRVDDEEFSEIRYLTSDETLDFALATPSDYATDL